MRRCQSDMHRHTTCRHFPEADKAERKREYTSSSSHEHHREERKPPIGTQVVYVCRQTGSHSQYIGLQTQKVKHRLAVHTRRGFTQPQQKGVTSIHRRLYQSSLSLHGIVSQFATQHPGFVTHCCVCVAEDVRSMHAL